MLHRSVRLHLDNRFESSSSSSSATTESVLSSWTDGEPPGPPLPLFIDIQGLLADAEALHDCVDFAAFVDLAETPQLPQLRDGQAQWKRIERSSSFTLLKCEDEVLALARLDASVEEVASILTSTTDALHAATLRGLYGEAFIAGSVAFVHRPESYEEDQMYHQLVVKTTSFVHSDLLGKNEQWCFAESFRRKPDGDSFTLTQGSLSADQAHYLPARVALKDNTQRVAQLRGVTVAYLVEKLPGSHGVRVTFHATYKPDVGSEEGAPVVLRKAVRTRLRRLARGVSQLSQLVRRRRLGAQVFADRSAFETRNSRCTCCTQRLTPFIKFIQRTRCYLCGYYVCVSCSSSEKMETHNGRLASIIVCTRCVKSVTACNYEHMLTVIPGGEYVLPDQTSTLRQSVRASCTPGSRSSSSNFDLSRHSSSSSGSSSSQKLAELLGQVVDVNSGNVTPGRRDAALMVLEQLLNVDQDATQAQADENKNLFISTASSPLEEKAKQAMDISACPRELAACTLASANTRPYSMLPVLVEDEHDSDGPAEPITYPIPANEGVRLTAIEQFSLHEIANVSELNMICKLAAAEMDCPHSVITLVECEVVTILASNSPEDWSVGSSNPREQSFCQHFIMEDQPLLVRHAEADMRFYHTDQVVHRSLRFYAGFPVSVTAAVDFAQIGNTGKVVVGALCCLDVKPHQMTRSQYWRLTKLAQAASKILERNAKEYVAAPTKMARKQEAQATEAQSSVAVAC